MPQVFVDEGRRFAAQAAPIQGLDQRRRQHGAQERAGVRRFTEEFTHEMIVRMMHGHVRGSVAQQFVQADPRAGFLIDLLDDHRAV